MSENSQDIFNLTSPLNNPTVMQTQPTSLSYPNQQTNLQQPQQIQGQNFYPQAQQQYNQYAPVGQQYQSSQPMTQYPQSFDQVPGMSTGMGTNMNAGLNTGMGTNMNVGGISPSLSRAGSGYMYPGQPYPQVGSFPNYPYNMTPTTKFSPYSPNLGLSNGYSSYNTTPTTYRTASEILSQANTMTASQQNFQQQQHQQANVTHKDGVKLTISLHGMPQQTRKDVPAPAKGKGLMSRVFNAGSFNNGVQVPQQRVQASAPYNQTRALPNYSTPSARSDRSNNRSRSRSNNNGGRSRGRTIPSELHDSEDDDFIDDRDADELSNESDRSDLSIGEEVNELLISSNRLTRKRRREEGGSLMDELEDDLQTTYTESFYGELEYDYDENGNKRQIGRAHV